MYKLFLSLKYLRHRLVNWISVICVALAVTVLLVVLAVMGGFHSQLLRSYQAISADLLIDADGLYPLPVSKVRRTILATDHVAGCAMRFFAYGIVGRESRIVRGGNAGIKIFGVDPSEEKTTTHFVDHLQARDLPPERRVKDLQNPFDAERFRDPEREPKPVPGIIVGEDLLKALGARVGEKIMLGAMAFSGDDPTEMPAMREMGFCVVGAISSGMYEFDAHTVFIPRRYEVRDEYGTETIDVERDFLGRGGGGRELYVRLDDFRYADEVRDALLAKFPGALIQTWKERHRTFLSAVETEKAIQAVILSFMILLAGGSIMSVLTMTVVEKTRDIGTLKALGGTLQGTLQIFVLNGFVIGLIGSLLGLALGILIIENINFIDREIVANVIGHRIFRPEIYVFDQIPTETNLPSMVTTVLVTLGVSVLSSIAPALKAARYRPVEALRYE